jgi:hypothetical protein
MENIDTTNRFAVGVNQTGVVILGTGRLLSGPLTKDDALNLAAWLATLADPTGTEFPKYLEAIQEA